ncbi:uncharacterized protein LOC131941213 isoform X2 [Physella acuta]|nr:uncharacterized protein LOC131941213 isoform X2 [Physella acuta]
MADVDQRTSDHEGRWSECGYVSADPTISDDSVYLQPLAPPSYSELTETALKTGRIDSGMGDSFSDDTNRRYQPTIHIDDNNRRYQPTIHIDDTNRRHDRDATSRPLEQHYEDIEVFGNHSKSRSTCPPPALPNHNPENNHVIPISIAETLSSPSGDQPFPSSHIYSQLQVEAKVVPAQHLANRCSVHYVIALAIVFLVSFTSLALGIFALYKKIPDNNQTTTQQTHLELTYLQNKIQNLTEMHKILLEELGKKLPTDSIEPLQNEMKKWRNEKKNLTVGMEALERKLLAEIQNISLLKGDNGLPGTVNFSLCTQKSEVVKFVSSELVFFPTHFLPSPEDLQKNVVLFAYCNYENARESFLEADPDGRRYRCKCRGKVESVSHSLCKLHVVMCPNLTP